MARFGMVKKGAAPPATPPTVQPPSGTTNKAGGEAFDITDPSLRMLSMLGASFWNEPQYYGDTPGAERLPGLSDEATLIVQTAKEIAASEQPRDLLVLAHWARTEMNLRTTPQVLLAIAAGEPETKEFVRSYCTKVIQRADELRQVFAAFLTLYAGGIAVNKTGQKLPNSLKRGLADAFHRFSPAQIMKYDTEERPTFRDVLRMIDRGKDRAVSQALYKYLTTGELTDEASLPTVAARKALVRKNTLDDEARELIKKAHAPWEFVLSHFGSKREVWEAVLPELGYMALLRNLRNLVEAGVDLAPVVAKLSDKREVERSKQLPFRFYSAFMAVAGSKGLDPRIPEALQDALAHSVAALPRLPGVTVLASDNSGSMETPVSAKSQVTRRAASNLLASIGLRISDEGLVYVFAETAQQVPVEPNGNLFDNMAKQASTHVGYATNAHLVVKQLLEQKRRVDRLVLFSDMQCWNSSGGPESLAGYVAEYRKKVNPSLFVHSIDLAGYGKSAVVPGDPRTQLLSGFSEKVLSMVLSFEESAAVLRAVPAPTEASESSEPPRQTLPTMEELRARF